MPTGLSKKVTMLNKEDRTKVSPEAEKEVGAERGLACGGGGGAEG